MDFDTPIDRRGTHCVKWDMMEPLFGVSPRDGLAMWVADMEFRAAPVIQDAVEAMHDHGVYGYFGDDTRYRDAIRWWMRERHGWDVDPKAIFTTHGLVHGVGMCVDTFTAPDDGIVLFTPVYHAFARVIRAAGREVVECELALEDDKYVFDFEAYDAQMTGNEQMLIFCSPHNPGGRVWTRSELRAVAAFAKRHDLILISDEIHHDLVMPGHTHIPMASIDGIDDRLIKLTAPSKTFNIAGAHTGHVIIENPDLRAQFAARMAAMGISGNTFGMFMTTAAYTPQGAEWVDAVVRYIDGNRRVFDAGIAAIPGLKSMPLEATYLSWVDFSGTGMSRKEFTSRVEQGARIAANHGPTFGKGGHDHLRFNIAAPRAQVEDAIERLTAAFSDLQ